MPQTPPPPDPNRVVLDLLLQIKEAKSPLARVRVVARAWRAVRSLTPKQRYEVAAQLGLDGADDLIEAIAAHQGTTPPAELMKAVNEVQQMDPATLKSIASRVRDPQQRGGVLKEGLQAIEAALAGPPAKPAPAPPRAAPAALPVTAKPATSWPLREAPPAARPSPPPPPSAPAPVLAPAPVPAPAPATPPAPVPVAAPAAPAPAPVRPPEPAPPPRPSIPSAPAPPARPALAEHLAALPALIVRFRHLRRHLDQVRGLSSADLRGVLEVFPDGWARRRALSELIGAGVPARTADVLSLVDALQSPGDRAWCLGALADSRTLSSDERSALLQAAATPAGRRRLELRLGDR
jgi:hypothetical protein